MGYFSWMTKGTGESIANRSSGRPTFEVFMVLPDGTTYKETNYDGYGRFGGKDYYEALSEINGGPSDRSHGIDLFYDDKAKLFPQLVRDPAEATDFTTPNESCPDQGFFYCNEEEEDDEW